MDQKWQPDQAAENEETWSFYFMTGEIGGFASPHPDVHATAGEDASDERPAASASKARELQYKV